MWQPTRLSIAILVGLLTWASAQTGKLSADDPKLNSGHHYDSYPYQGTQGETLTIKLSSPDFDVYLLVLDPDGRTSIGGPC